MSKNSIDELLKFGARPNIEDLDNISEMFENVNFNRCNLDQIL